MKSLDEFLSFKPQLTEPRYGPEPSLKGLIEEYYKDMWNASEEDKASTVKAYIEALKEEFSK